MMWVVQTVVPLAFDLQRKLARKIIAQSGTFLVKQGEPTSEFFYLHSGLIRAIYVSTDGSERISPLITLCRQPIAGLRAKT